MPLAYSKLNLSKLPWFSHAKEIIEICNQIRNWQGDDGSLQYNDEEATACFEQLISHVQSLSSHFHSGYIDSLERDLKDWQTRGLNTRPDFGMSFNHYQRETNYSFGFFLFPIYELTYKTRDVRMEACFLYRNENDEIDRLRTLYPNAVFQGAELLLGTHGLVSNNIFTLFPENIAVKDIQDQKKFAYFFINNYLNIYLSVTRPIGRRLLGEAFEVLGASDDEVFDARCAFSFVHDHYHYVGKLPFNEFYAHKTTLLGSFFEEARVETITFVQLFERNNRQCLMAAEIILLERLFRYCYTNEPQESFDTLTNYFFLHYLLDKRAIQLEQMSFSIDLLAVRDAFQTLYADMDALETRMLCSPPQHFEAIIKSWASPYLSFEEDGTVSRTLFAEWLKQQHV